MNATQTIDQIGSDLKALGVKSGGMLMVHASLKALGPVAGGIESVIQGLQAALGNEGTLFMPALSYELVTRDQPQFNLTETPSNVGTIPEYFRTRPGTLRSLHPTHSVCGIGPLAATLLNDHFRDATPCGPHSPFYLLPQYAGQILMLGCGLRPNTSMHAIEELVEPPYLFGEPLRYQLIDARGHRSEKTYRVHHFSGYEQRYDRVETLLTGDNLKIGKVLKAECYLIEAQALWEVALKALKDDPLYFVELVVENDC